MPLYRSPQDFQKIRQRALELAVESKVPGSHMVQFAVRAHYFAHFIADEDRNTACVSVTCPFQVPLVPNDPIDAEGTAS